MRSLASLVGILLVIGFVVKFIWLILSVAVLAGLFYLVRAMVRKGCARREVEARRNAAIAARADQQHRWALQGDPRGTYGQYLTPHPPYRVRGGECADGFGM